MLQKDQLLDRHNSLKDVSFGQETQQKLSGNSYVQINEGINTYGLITFISAYPSGQSECMRQRAALIRSLLLEPDILLLDEPFSALDDETRLEAADHIWEMLRKEKKTVILITDNIGEAISLADRIIVLSSCPGVIKRVFDIRPALKELTPSEARNTPEFLEHYRMIKEEMDHSISCT
jgi:NitT/TauT family transport system ATP-binding protein